MANTENLIPIPGRLKNVAVGGHVAGADMVYDDTIGKTQEEINSDVSSNKADKTSTVSNVTYDSSSRKIQKTINGTTTDVVTLPEAQVNSDWNASSGVAQILNKPSSLPASDVSAWAKAPNKPSYTKGEVGLGNVDNTADADKHVAFAEDAGTVNSHTVNADVPSGAVFTDTTYTFDGTYNASTNKAATVSTVTNAINALDATKSQTAGTDGLALSITETDGKITSISGSIAANTYDAYGAASTAKTEVIGGASSSGNTLKKLEDSIPNLKDIEQLASDYTFKVNDHLVLNGVLYKCTAATANTPFTLLVQDGKLLYNTVNGQKCYMVSSMTLNAGWTKVCDIDDKFYVEDRVKNFFDIKTSSNAAVLGNGYGVCDTTALSTAKTVAIGNFILKTNGIISVRFTNAIGTADSTLNVSGTGAKVIRINGGGIQPGVVRPGNTVILQYDGIYWNIISIMGFEKSAPIIPYYNDLIVDLGLPSGLKWARKNVAASKSNGFASSEFSYDDSSYFSWGNTAGYEPSNGTFYYDFGTSNSGPYASTSGAKLTGNISPSMDVARIYCGSPWRMPTTDEFKELVDNCNFVQADGSTVISASTVDKRIEKSGCIGIYLRSKVNGNLIFFPCCGYGYSTTLNNLELEGYYWSASFGSASNAQNLGFSSNGVGSQGSSSRFNGFPIRPVM